MQTHSSFASTQAILTYSPSQTSKSIEFRERVKPNKSIKKAEATQGAVPEPKVTEKLGNSRKRNSQLRG